MLDQIVKKYVAKSMELNESIPVIQDLFHITYIENRGAAFSMLEGAQTFLIILPTALIIAALIYIFKKRKQAHWMLMLAVSFIVGGGIGNLIDRIAYGQVTDYFDVKGFAIFNIADIFVCVGCGLLILQVLFFDRKEQKTH